MSDRGVIVHFSLSLSLSLSISLFDRVWGVIGEFLTFRAVHAMEPWETVTYSWHTLSVAMTVTGTLLHRICEKNETFLYIKKATLTVMTAVTTISNSHLVFSSTASFLSFSFAPVLSGGLWSLLIQPIQIASHAISLAMSISRQWK